MIEFLHQIDEEQNKYRHIAKQIRLVRQKGIRDRQKLLKNR